MHQPMAGTALSYMLDAMIHAFTFAGPRAVHFASLCYQ